MADDSDKIPEVFNFHPCEAPRGMAFYRLGDLTTAQKTKLNKFKLNIIRENQRYLQFHPEIKALVIILLKAVLKARPKIRLHTFLSKYLNEHWMELQEMMEIYEEERKKANIKFEEYKEEVVIEEERVSSTETTVSSEFTEQEAVKEEQEQIDADKICKDIVEEIIEKLPIREHDTFDDLEDDEEELGEEQSIDSEGILIFPKEGSFISNESNNEKEHSELITPT